MWMMGCSGYDLCVSCWESDLTRIQSVTSLCSNKVPYQGYCGKDEIYTIPPRSNSECGISERLVQHHTGKNK